MKVRIVLRTDSETRAERSDVTIIILIGVRAWETISKIKSNIWDKKKYLSAAKHM